MKENEKMEQIILTEKNELVNVQKNNTKNEEGNLPENNLEEEESLGYNMTYKPFLVDYKQGQNNQNLLRKSSTISTTLSENGLDIFNPKRCDIDSNDDIEYSSQIFFGRNRFYSTPISDYFEGIDNYLKGLNPEKNNYQKTNNYLKKEKFFSREHFASVDLINLKTEENNSSIKTCPKLSVDINLQNAGQNPPPLTPNNNTPNFTFQKNMIQNYGKFDFSMCCYKYYSLECK